MSLKFTMELCVMAMKNDAKIEDEFTCQFKIVMKNLKILIRVLKNLKHFHFNGLSLTKVCNV